MMPKLSLEMSGDQEQDFNLETSQDQDFSLETETSLETS